MEAKTLLNYDLINEEIAKAWKEVLNIESLDSDADFFKLGGDSMGAIQVLIVLQDVLDVKIPLATLFVHRQFSHFVKAVFEEISTTNGETVEA